MLGPARAKRPALPGAPSQRVPRDGPDRDRKSHKNRERADDHVAEGNPEPQVTDEPEEEAQAGGDGRIQNDGR